MQSARDIKRRIRSVENIAQITKAMEVVSMTKMRRSQQFALAARPYAQAALGMLHNIIDRTHGNLPIFMRDRVIKDSLLVIVTADKGLVGGFNDNVIAQAEMWLQEQKEKGITPHIITVGRKAREYCERRNIKIEKSFVGFGDYTAFADTKPIADRALKGFVKLHWDSVDIVYTHFRSTLKQETMRRKILPVKPESLNELIKEIIPDYKRYSSDYTDSYTFEPTPEIILHSLVTTILQIAFHHIMLESNASEHSARMVTMKSASDNAIELEGKLTLAMNKARQAGITAEISEIIAGAEALQ